MFRKISGLITAVFLVLIILFTAGCGTRTVGTTATSSAPATTNPTTAKATTTGAATSTTTTIKTLPPITSPKTTQPKPPSQVSGIVYYRDAAVSYPVDAVPTEQALQGAKISIAPDTAISDASGGYTFDITPGFHTITVAKDGYIPTTVSWNFLSNESYVFNIGLYKAPASINPRPGFINGVITWDAGGWLIDYYYKRGLFQPTYSNIAENAGGNMVTVSDPLFIKEASADHIVMSNISSEGSYWRVMNETEYTALVNDAHSNNLQFMLWIGVMDEGKTDYTKIIYTDSPRTDSFWDTWFSEYEKYAVPAARMAEKLGIEYINLGHDMSYATGKSHYSGNAADCLARWQKLTAAIRAVYHGKLTYFGGISTVWTFYEDDDYPPGFIDLFDAIGVNIQEVSSTFNPSLDELKVAVKNILDRYTSWTCPLFVMIRTPSVDGGTSFDTYIEPLLIVDQEALKHKMNVWQQADMYEAFYEVINERPSGSGQVMGIFPWGYNYLDDYLFTPGKIDGYMAMDKSGNIRGKPAEALMNFWNFR